MLLVVSSLVSYGTGIWQKFVSFAHTHTHTHTPFISCMVSCWRELIFSLAQQQTDKQIEGFSMEVVLSEGTYYCSHSVGSPEWVLRLFLDELVLWIKVQDRVKLGGLKYKIECELGWFKIQDRVWTWVH
jgi:hypothetical protein